MTDLFDRFRVIDVDTHLTEPPDVWTARLPARCHDQVPHIERIDGRDIWMADGERIGAPGFYSMAGFDGVLPASIPPTYDDIAPAMYDADARLRVPGRARASTPRCSTRTSAASGTATSCSLGDRELVLACVRAYNDFLTDWCSADPDRLIADHGAAVLGRRPGGRRDASAASPTATGRSTSATSPRTTASRRWPTSHWDPIWAAAQEAGVPVSFHVGGGSMGTQFDDTAGMGWMTNFAKVVVADLHRQHALHRRPDLRRRLPPLPRPEVRVGRERASAGSRARSRPSTGSGATAACADEHPEYDLLPSEYFRRQIYGCFWFERAVGARRDRAATRTTSSTRPTTRTPPASTPGPARRRSDPRDYAEPRARRRCPTTCSPKVLHDNAPRSTASDDRPDLELDAPDLGSPHIGRRASGAGSCTCASTGWSGATPSPRTCTAAIKRAAIWADDQPELDAVCLTGTDEWFGAGGDMAGRRRATPRVSPPSGTRPTTSRSATSSAARSSGWPGSTGCATPAGSSLTLHCDVADRLRPGPLPRARAAAGHPRPVPRRPAGRGRRPGPGPLPLLHRGRDRRRTRPRRMGLVGTVVPHDELDARVDCGARADRPHRPGARAGGEARPQPAAAGRRRRRCSSAPSARPRWSRAWPPSSRSARRSGPAG